MNITEFTLTVSAKWQVAEFPTLDGVVTEVNPVTLDEGSVTLSAISDGAHDYLYLVIQRDAGGNFPYEGEYPPDMQAKCLFTDAIFLYAKSDTLLKGPDQPQRVGTDFRTSPEPEVRKTGVSHDTIQRVES